MSEMRIKDYIEANRQLRKENRELRARISKKRKGFWSCVKQAFKAFFKELSEV